LVLIEHTNQPHHGLCHLAQEKLPWNFPVGTEEDHKKSQSGTFYLVKIHQQHCYFN